MKVEPWGSDRRLASDEALEFFELNELIQYVRRGETYVVPAAVVGYELRSDGRAALRILHARPSR